MAASSSGATEDFNQRLVGFGKYRECTFLELLSTNKKYCQWVLSQEGMETSHPVLVQYLKNNGIMPVVATDHNFFQAEFVEREAIEKIVKLTPFSYIIKEYTGSMTLDYSITFEPLCLSDIRIDIDVDYRSSMLQKSYHILVELKPTLSNDYPEVLRQMRKQEHAFLAAHPDTKDVAMILVYQLYTGAVPIETVRKMFLPYQMMEWDSTRR